MIVLDDPGGPSVIRSVLLRGRRGRFSHRAGGVPAESETGTIWPQARECRKNALSPLEAGRGKEAGARGASTRNYLVCLC